MRTNVRRSRAAAVAEEFGERVVRSIWLLLPLLAAAVIFASAADAATTTGTQRRVALVIGNSAYQYAPHLPNPTSDAEAMAATLKTLGFEVTKGIDLDQSETRLILREFSKTLPGADVALLYYAGHGLQVDSHNYLIPVDAQLADENDLKFEATELTFVLGLMESEPRVNLVFLDACRDNPLSQNLARSMGTSRSTSVGRGLALVKAEVGSFVAYATQPDAVAADGSGAHSPFTSALLKYMETPGLSLSDMMVKVRNDVISETGGKQVPRDDSSLTGSFYFQPQPASLAMVGSPDQVPSTPTQAPSNTDKEALFWQSIQDSKDPAAFEAYLAQFPNGTFAPLAQLRIAQLKAKPAEPVADSNKLASTAPVTTVPDGEEVERGLGLTKQGRSRAQLALTLLGYNTGGHDGVFGTKSRKAISDWQADRGETATGYLTAKQHAALLETAAPKLAAWDAEQQKRRAAEQAAAAEAAKRYQEQQQQQQQNNSYAATTKPSADAQAKQAAAAEAERLRQENEQLKKQAQEKEAAQNDDGPDVNIGLGVGVGAGHSHGVGLFPSISIFGN